MLFAGGGGAAAGYFLWYLPQQEAEADGDETETTDEVEIPADVTEAQENAAEAIADAQQQATEAANAAQAAAADATEAAADAVADGTEAAAEAVAEGTEAAAEGAEAVAEGTEAVAEAAPAEAAPAEAAPAEAAPAEAAPAEAAQAEAPAEAPSGRRGRRVTYEQRAQAAARGAARQCYQQNNAHGAVTIQISVGHDGRITTSRVVNNGTGNQNVARCISGALVGRRIGNSTRGGATMNVSFQG